jgi:hypothetical protein
MTKQRIRIGAGCGVTRSLTIDPHGKSLSALILTIELPD